MQWQMGAVPFMNQSERNAEATAARATAQGQQWTVAPRLLVAAVVVGERTAIPLDTCVLHGACTTSTTTTAWRQAAAARAM